MSEQHVIVLGGGISGLVAAQRVVALQPGACVSVFEADDRLGGKIKSSPFAGIESVDEGADAFLTRVPHAIALAHELGLDDQLTSPAVGAASVWWHGLHPIPEGLVLGVPSDLARLARSHLLSWPGKLRAALEPVLPATGVGADSVGLLIRKRFGTQVHERLVDPLVGSIYAADTDRFSLAGVPQILDLARANRSLLIGARRQRATAPPTTGPVFAAPRAGVGALIDALTATLRASGVEVHTSCRLTSLERADRGWTLDGVDADVLVLATPARSTAPLLAAVSPDAANALRHFDHAGVVMLTLAIDAATLPDSVRGLSGYLVPKPVQRWVTAVSFATAKWPHWQPAPTTNGADQVVLRVSLGRDGRDLTGETDDELLAAAVDEIGGHLGVDVQPTAHRVSRWPLAFPQYRPGHTARVDAIEAALARDSPGVFVTGASYRGIGIPACIGQAGITAGAVSRFLDSVRN